MTRARRTLTLLAAAVAMLPIGTGPTARAEITTGVPPSVPPPTSLRISANQPVKAECWQQGVKILDQTGLWSINLGSLLRDQTVLLQSRQDGPPDLYILAAGQATCIVRRQ